MKRFFALICMLVFVAVSIFVVKGTQAQVANTQAFTSGYAKVLTNDCYFCKNPSQDSRMFLLEQSYFVKVLDDKDTQYFFAEYLEFEGYVLKSDVSFVEEYPKMPYLTGITFDIYDLGNVCLRQTPTSVGLDSNILCTILPSTKNLTYYGKCTGSEAIEGLGNVWYFCAYQDDFGKLYKGYIYSALTRNLSAITSSVENLTLVSTKNFSPVSALLYLNLSTKNMLIVITTIPTLFVVYLLVYPSKIKHDD